MRVTWAAALVLIGLPAMVAAQSRTHTSGKSPHIPYPSIGLPLPPIGLPLPPIGLPPRIHAAPPRIHQDIRSQGFRPHRSHFGSQKGFRSAPTFLYLVPTYGWGYDWPPAPPVTVPTVSPIRERLPEREFGQLWLEVQPGGIAQVFVDSYYVGVPDDFVRGLELDAGPHRIEIRAPGYETLAFDVRIDANRAITYRGELKPIETRPVPSTDLRKPEATSVSTQPATPAAPSTFYVIPGCYVGNVPPTATRLPGTCDLDQLVTYNP